MKQVVECRYGWDPPAQESGTLSEFRDSENEVFTGDFAFEPAAGGWGWVQSGKYDGGTIVASLGNPSGGKINYLRFERTD